MAGEWIKFDSSLPEKPETMAITVAMGWDDTDLTVGKLMRLFRWFDQHTTNGNAVGVTPALLDRLIGATGFVQAVENAGWLTITSAGLSLRNFEKHNGATAKGRAQTAKRVAAHRAAAGDSSGCNARSVTPALAREEKRREEQEHSNSSSPAATTDDPTASKTQQRTARLKQVTADAVEAYNRILGKPNGLLPAVHLVNDVRTKNVARCLDTARAICACEYGAPIITPEFWSDYFEAAAEDPFCAGKVAGGPGHETWSPDFEYLTKPATMTKIFDKVLSEAAA